ncbi:putative SLACS reverse transcriptase [Trypanosoma cruzi]|uniref:Putative SLACS reverse transcriptase n=1 Tax=Trypanosoma cruzi TaxID=5693 RepID=A0A2V2UJ25_TRYCR|nr:putative SLACS reverse transcriptase [Trypanosoma cruzi]
MEITAILTDMANGNVARRWHTASRATNLTVLRKPNKKFRPIGAECVWAKTISLMAVDAVMPASKPALRTCNTGSATAQNWRLRRFGRTSTSRAAWPCWTAGMRTTPLVARPSYPPSMVTPHGAHSGGSHDSSGHGRAGGLLRKGTIGPLVEVDAGSATRHGAGTGPFSIGTIATLRQLESSFPNASFTAYLDDVTVETPPGMLGQVCEATSRAMRALGIETNEDKTEVLHTDGPVDMPAEYIRPFARVLGAGIATTQRAS